MAVGSDGIPFRAYLGVVLRWKWVVVACFVVAMAAAAGYAFQATPQYAATAELIYQPQIDIANPLQQQFVDRTERQSVLESVPTVVGSPGIAEVATEELSPRARTTPSSVSVELQPGVEDTYSNVVRIVAVSTDPDVAAEVANAYAAAFIDWRRQQAQAQITEAIKAVRNRLAALDTPEGRQSAEYSTLQQRLSDLDILKATVTGSFAIITPASPPSQPFSPDWTRLLLFGALGGLIVGLIGAFVLAQFDTRIRSEEQVVQELPMPVLGRVPRLPQRVQNGDVIPTLTKPDGSAAEAYRVLRSNLEFMVFEGDVSRIMMTSSLQSEGKSIAACNLAVALALAGKRVALIDCDMRNPSLHGYLGLPNAVGTSSVIARRTDLESAVMVVDLRPGTRVGDERGRAVAPAAAHQAVVRGPVASLGKNGPESGESAGFVGRFLVLTSGPVPPNPGELVASSRFSQMVEQVSQWVDLAILDAPALLLVGDAAALSTSVDGLLYVVNPTVVRRPQLQHAADQLAQLPCRKLGLVVVQTKAIETRYHYKGYYYRKSGKAASSVPTARAPRASS